MRKIITLMAALLVMAVTAKAQTQPINVVCNQASAQYYAEDNDLYIELQNAEYGFAFDVVCAAGSRDIVDGQTYTLNDMLADYSYGFDQAAQAYINYVSASITRVNGSYTATVVADDGNTYNITYTVVTPIDEPTDTIVVDMTTNFDNRAFDLISSMGVIQLIGYSNANDYMMNVVFNTTQFAGSYTLADRYPNDQYFMLYSVDAQGNNTPVPCNNLLEATVTGTASNCTAHIKWVAADGTMYDISFAYADPTAQTQQTFTATDLTITEDPMSDIYAQYYGYYVFSFQASNGTQILSGELHPTAKSPLGTWNMSDGDIEFNLYDAITGEPTSEPFNGTITIAQAQDGSYTLTGTSLFYGNVEWTFNCSFDATPEDTITILMDNAEYNSIIDYTSYMGMYQLQGADQNQEYTMLLAVNSDQIAGSYTQSDIENYYSGLIHIVGNDTTYIDFLSVADFTVTGNAKSCSTYVEILGDDHNLYQITYTYTYVAPEPVDTVVITMDNEEFNMVNDQTSMGYFQLVGADQDEEYLMQLVVYSDQLAGSYTMSDVETDYTQLIHCTATDTTAIEIEDIRDFMVAGDSTGCSMYIEILSTDLVLYKITYTYGDAPEPPTSVDNVNETEFVVVSENNAIMVYTAEGEDIMVCDMAGRVIMNGKTASDVERIDVAVPGIYVVRVADRAVKVLVK